MASGKSVAVALGLSSLSPGYVQGKAAFNAPLDHPYTLRNPQPEGLEWAMRSQTLGSGPMSFAFPRACDTGIGSGGACGESHGFSFRDPSREGAIGISPQAGYDFRHQNDAKVNALDFGILSSGNLGDISFYLDARMFTEFRGSGDTGSFDGEFVERQTEAQSGTIAYSSYSRFRSNLNYDWRAIRVSVAKDALHWGPGLFTNLVFNQGTIPFEYLDFTASLGPLTVRSVYGRLSAGLDWESDATDDRRSLYAHRYEWKATGDFVLGISEQLILFDSGNPFLFTPVAPLFILKAGSSEPTNNGSLAADFAWRPRPGLLCYSEFLIDDLQSPTALFGDFWGNKWGWMAGMHAAREFGALKPGAILEYSRVEPWVYTHYSAHTTQAANGNTPLGNPYGPNSQALILKLYARISSAYAALRSDFIWKGRDPGSSINDTQRSVADGKKEFLAGAGRPDFDLTGSFQYDFRRLSMMLDVRGPAHGLVRLYLLARY